MTYAATRWPLVLASVAVLVVLVVGCGDRSRRAPDGPPLETMDWSPIDGADAYRVRGWSDSRLLFEVNTVADSLPWTPSLRRAAVAFDTVRIRVQALDVRGEAFGDPREVLIRPTPGRDHR